MSVCQGKVIGHVSVCQGNVIGLDILPGQVHQMDKVHPNCVTFRVMLSWLSRRPVKRLERIRFSGADFIKIKSLLIIGSWIFLLTGMSITCMLSPIGSSLNEWEVIWHINNVKCFHFAHHCVGYLIALGQKSPITHRHMCFHVMTMTLILSHDMRYDRSNLGDKMC